MKFFNAKWHMNRSKWRGMEVFYVKLHFQNLSPEQAPDLYHQLTTNTRYRIPWFVWQAAHNGWSIAEKMKLLIAPLVYTVAKLLPDLITIQYRIDQPLIYLSYVCVVE